MTRQTIKKLVRVLLGVGIVGATYVPLIGLGGCNLEDLFGSSTDTKRIELPE